MAPLSIKQERLPLVVIVGPTASGKTSLAVDLAEQFKGEIICADSRTVYKGMDIGTAKPDERDRARVPHWGIDLVHPSERFTAVDFKQYATQKIDEIRERGHIPFLVGGTGLYVDAIIFDYQFGNDADADLRKRFENWPADKLRDYCVKNSITLPINELNRRHLIHAIEQKNVSVKRRSRPDASTIIVGIATEKDVLTERIQHRTEQLFENGVVEEATLLGKKYGWNYEAMTGNIYRFAQAYLSGELTLEDYKKKVTTSDWQLAKRQMTWFRRNPFINWFSLKDARTYLTQSLAKMQ